MKFRFTYETLLKHRKTNEEIAMRDYLESKSELDEQLAILDGMYKSIEDSRELAAQLTEQGGSRGEELQQIEQYIRGEHIRIQRHREGLREYMQKVEEKQEILVHAAQEFKTLDHLREKERLKFKKNQQRKEIKEVDDLVVMRFKRSE